MGARIDLPEDEIKAEFEMGASSQEIAEEYGISWSTIRDRLREWRVKRLPCACGCGQRANPGYRFVVGHQNRGRPPWCKGFTKYTHLSLASTSETHKGRPGHTPWNKDLTKDTHPSLMTNSEKQMGEKNHGWMGGPVATKFWTSGKVVVIQ